MIVVSDTSPLNYLVLIGEVELLQSLFSGVIVPPGVVEELRHPRTPTRVAAWARALPSWIDIVAPMNPIEAPGLGRGETEAIAVASQTAAELTLIDERRASIEARRAGLNITGTLGVLHLAAKRGLVDPASAVSRLLDTSFRVTPAVIEAFLNSTR